MMAAATQGVSPQFNGLTGNNLNLNDQQNGGCMEPLYDGLEGFPV